MTLRKISDSVGEYIYEPLDLTKNQIRLLAIRPSHFPDDPVECDFQVFDVHDAPHYVALSYVWGEPNPERYILLNGRRSKVRQNLFDFLLCFRDDPSNIHYLWIDQLCIAQTLDLERNHQVRLMSRIYRRCLYVIMWLGPTSYPAAFSFNKEPAMSSAYQIFNNQYFTRLWVVQEILLAPEIRMFCGETAEWDPVWGEERRDERPIVLFDEEILNDMGNTDTVDSTGLAIDQPNLPIHDQEIVDSITALTIEQLSGHLLTQDFSHSFTGSAIEEVVNYIFDQDIVNNVTMPTNEQLDAYSVDQDWDSESTGPTVGRAWVPVDTLVSVMRSGAPEHIKVFPVFYDSIFGNPDILQRLKSWKMLPLADCIRAFSKYECSNLRDKVYGLLGLVIEDQRLVVDYSKPEVEVIADVIMVMAKLYWQETGDRRTIPNTKVQTQYWEDVLCLMRLAKDMDLEKHCYAISYLLQEIYDVIARSKDDGNVKFPIQAIGIDWIAGNGTWWFKGDGSETEDQKLYLLDYPRMPAWKRMGFDVLPQGIPERFQPIPRFHLDGTPWIRPDEKEDADRSRSKDLSAFRDIVIANYTNAD